MAPVCFSSKGIRSSSLSAVAASVLCRLGLAELPVPSECVCKALLHKKRRCLKDLMGFSPDTSEAKHRERDFR